jgi:hypothetical protein
LPTRRYSFWYPSGSGFIPTHQIRYTPARIHRMMSERQRMDGAYMLRAGIRELVV